MLFAIGMLFLLLLIAFLLGSIPWGVVISKIFYKKDIRKEGSGNIGTTNAMRSLGKVGGACVFILDFAKGLLAGLIASIFAGYLYQVDLAQSFGQISSLLYGLGLNENMILLYPDVLWQQICLSIGFFGCVLGHIYSPWLKFKGGKGIAVAIGALFFTFGFVGAIVELLVFVIFVILTRYVSVGSIASSVVCPPLAFIIFWPNWFSFLLCSATAIIVIIAHRQNIVRLYHHSENRIGSKEKEE